MKEAIKKIIEIRLKRVAFFILKKQKPEIVGITGSVGKTSTREAIVFLLSKKYEVYAPTGSYNTEIGVPLAIIGVKSPKNIYNVFSWLIIILKGYKRAFDKAYPKMLVLEMGINKPGDMDWLVSFVKPNVGIVTAIAPVHMINFKNIKEIEREKLKLIKATKELAIINEDQVGFFDSSIPVIFYGKRGRVSYKEPKFSVKGSEFVVSLGKSSEKFSTKMIGSHSIYSILAAVACGHKYGFTLSEMATLFKGYRPYNGRMNPLEGASGTFIIDDSYNSSPESAKAAIKTIHNFIGRKILALGSMNELGKLTKEAHTEVGVFAAKAADMLITVGEDANKYLAGGATKNGLKAENVFKFQNSREAGLFLKKQLKNGDIILVKGSQNKVFMEELTKEILKNKKDVQYLVRQSAFWLRTKEKFFRLSD